ncbi:MAG: hypothetical protein GY842_01855, partial [bacterium]|nr:hypothetical protein [bacterium]
GTHPWGRIGVGYSEYFGDDANIHGARVDRFSATSDFPGDADGDGDVDIDDFWWFRQCIRGPDSPAGGTPFFPRSRCLEAYDFNYDEDVDLEDYMGFQLAFTGPS